MFFSPSFFSHFPRLHGRGEAGVEAALRQCLAAAAGAPALRGASHPEVPAALRALAKAPGLLEPDLVVDGQITLR